MSERPAGAARPALPREPRLDALRGLAIAAVLVLHFTLAFGLARSPLGAWLGRPLLAVLTLRGNYGVTLFFAISGFLITDHVLRRDGALQQLDWRRFAVERVSRLLPLLVLALLCVLVPGLLGWPFFAGDTHAPPMTAGRWAIALLSVLGFWHNQLMQDWGYFHYILNVYWSLSVEEVFYLGFAVLCLALGRGERVMMVAVALVLLGPLYRVVHPDDEIRYLYAYPACFDAIAWGVLAAWVAHRHPAAPARAAGARALGLAGIAAAWSVDFGAHPAWSFSALAAATALWLWALAGSRPCHPRWARLLAPWAWLGRHSYELYLFHIIVLALLRQVWSRQTLPDAGRLPLLAAYLALSAVVAWAVARGVGDPARRAWRRRWGRGEGRAGERVTIAPP